MRVEMIRPQGLYPGAPYAYAASTGFAPSGTVVFTAGSCPLDPDGRVVGEGDFEAQARQCIDNLFEVLAASGATVSDVLKTTVFVAANDRGDLVRVWDVVKAAFGSVDPPSTLLGVAMLGYPGQLVEIEAVATAPAPVPAQSPVPGAGR